MDRLTSIKFDPDLVPLIKNGTKTLTYRLGKKYDFLSVGDLINVAENDGKDFAEVEIVEKSEAKFKDIPLNRSGHEIYSSEEEKNKLFQKYYGRKIDPEEKFLVLGFKVIKFL